MYGRCLCAPGRSSRWSERWRGWRSRQHSGGEEGMLAGSSRGFRGEYETSWMTGWIIIVWPLVPTCENSLSSFSEMYNVCNQWAWCTEHYELLSISGENKSNIGPIWPHKVVQSGSMKQKVTVSPHLANSTLLNSFIWILFTVIRVTRCLCAFLSDLFLSFRDQVSWHGEDARCPTEDQAEERSTVSGSALSEPTWVGTCKTSPAWGGQEWVTGATHTSASTSRKTSGPLRHAAKVQHLHQYIGPESLTKVQCVTLILHIKVDFIIYS